MNTRPGFWSKPRNRMWVYGFALMLIFGPFMAGNPDKNLPEPKSPKKNKLEDSLPTKEEIQDIRPIANTQHERFETSAPVTPTTSVIKPSKSMHVGNSYADISGDVGGNHESFDGASRTSDPYLRDDLKKELQSDVKSNVREVSSLPVYENKKTNNEFKSKKEIAGNKNNTFGASSPGAISNNALSSLEKNTSSPEQLTDPADPETKKKKEKSVVYYASGSYSSEQICNQLASNESENNVFVFFDVYDQEQKKSQNNFYVFHIQNETRLGDFFNQSKSGEAYISSQNKIPYNYHQQASSRVFTQFFGTPKVSPNVQTNWKIYMLCKTDKCNGLDGSTVPTGGWFQIASPDQQQIKSNDAFAFLYNRRPFPKIDCVN